MSKIDAAKFIFSCQNWQQIALSVATYKLPNKVVLRNGLRFESPFIYWGDIYRIFLQHVYTPPLLAIEDQDVVVDIGANIGVFSLYAQH